MNRSLRLTECSHPISWVSVGVLQNVCWYLEERFVCISLAFATLSQSVSSRRGPIYRARVYENTHKMTNGNVRAIM